MNHNASSVRILAFQHTTTTAKVTDDVTSVLFWSFHFNLHDRLKQNWFRFLEAIFEGNRSGQFKRQFRGVNVVVRTEVQTHTEIYYWVTRQWTRLQLLLDAFINRRDEFTRNHTTFDFVDKLVAFRVGAWLQRVHVDNNMTILTTTTRLLSVFTFDVGNFSANRFTVSNLRLTYVRFNVKLTTHTVNQDVQVKLTHTCDDSLTRFFISPYTE